MSSFSPEDQDYYSVCLGDKNYLIPDKSWTVVDVETETVVLNLVDFDTAERFAAAMNASLHFLRKWKQESVLHVLGSNSDE